MSPLTMFIVSTVTLFVCVAVFRASDAYTSDGNPLLATVAIFALIVAGLLGCIACLGFMVSAGAIVWMLCTPQ
ncbi:MAG: hypothetical protein K2X29_13640 [Candidatus Obscuribacterales bacterium]|nr:hypothetical protein [Candidatus Obscuribacterales bacterium]